MEFRNLLKFGLPALIVVVVVWSKASNRSDASEAVRAEIMELMEQLDVRDADRKFIDTWSKVVHIHAFEQAYELGGRRRSASFDRDKYVDAFFSRMLRLAEEWKRNQLVEALRELSAREGLSGQIDPEE